MKISSWCGTNNCVAEGREKLCDVCFLALDHEYMTERAAVLGTGVGLARLGLETGDIEGAKSALDEAARKSGMLLAQFLP